MEANEVKAIDYLQSQDLQWIEHVASVIDSREQFEILLTYLSVLTDDGIIEQSCEQYNDMLTTNLSAGIKSIFDHVNLLVLRDRILIYSNYEYLVKCYKNLTGHELYEKE